MNDNAKNWVKILRSGRYPQGTEVLRGSDGKYCCLGVACELAVAEGVIPPASSDYLGVTRYGPTGDSSTTHLPSAVVEWLGLNSEFGYFGSGDSSLISLNDVGVPFSAIADIIEAEPEGLLA